MRSDFAWVYPTPSACPCRGGTLRKLGEDITGTLELIPRQWKVIQHVRGKLSCRKAITQPPAPSHPIARGRAGASLLAHLLLSTTAASAAQSPKQSLSAEGIDPDLSPLADWVGTSAATLMPLIDAIRTHVFAARRIHVEDTTVPVAKGKRTADYGPIYGRSPPRKDFRVALAHRRCRIYPAL